MIETLLLFLKKLIPAGLFVVCQPIYHKTLALLGAALYGFPSRKLAVIAVTGTKGKSSVVELINAILEEAGFVTALANTIRFKIRDDSRPNIYKMTMPGRFFLQRFLRKAVKAGCTHAVLEMTSEGARQFRHRFIELDALIFTNLAPEHIESHGSYENYIAAKVSIAEALQASKKRSKLLIVNGDDKEAEKFLKVFSGTKISYGRADAVEPLTTSDGVSFAWHDAHIESKLPGEFSLYNILAAITYAQAVGVPMEKIRSGIKKVAVIPGRAQKIEAGQNFLVVVDYAHTPDSLEKLYQTYAGHYRRCVLGNTGGGRDRWKRPVMAGVAEKYCDEIIFTNEDPYDENPEEIIQEMAIGVKHKTPLLILERRAAIRTALEHASIGDVVLITGKGTDPCICGPHGTKVLWDDASVVKEELEKVLFEKSKT